MKPSDNRRTMVQRYEVYLPDSSVVNCFTGSWVVGHLLTTARSRGILAIATSRGSLPSQWMMVIADYNTSGMYIVLYMRVFILIQQLGARDSRG